MCIDLLASPERRGAAIIQRNLALTRRESINGDKRDVDDQKTKIKRIREVKSEIEGLLC